MPYRNFLFEEDQPFHIISRAVDEREIFLNESDSCRFIFQIYAANMGKPNLNLKRYDVVKAANTLLRGEDVSDSLIIKEHSPLVHILDFALNVTHYHFYIVPTTKQSISLFIKKLNGGFAKYFNLKYNRKGSLFGSRYKSIPVKSDFQSDAVSRYIAIINPLDIFQPGWREVGLQDIENARQFLEKYSFSSFPDKIGKRKSKILAPEEILEKYFVKNFGEDSIAYIKDFLLSAHSPRNFPDYV